MPVLVRPLGDGDRPWLADALRAAWGSTAVARRGELVEVVELPGFVAEIDGIPVGLVTYAARGTEVEVVTLQADREGIGIGRALMDAAWDHACSAGAARLWLVTTNDNTRALRFYQRWGMDLVALVRDGVEVSRRVRPSIPAVGRDGIPMRHELELERRVPDAPGT